jgi:hypothetical protein
MGQTGRGGSSSIKLGGVCRRRGNNGGSYNDGRQQYDRHRDNGYYDMPYFPPPSSRFNDGSFGNFGSGGGSKDIGQRTCFICGSTGHQTKQSPKA